MKWKNMIEVGHVAYFAIMLTIALTGLLLDTIWILIIMLLAFIVIEGVSATLKFDQCTGPSRDSIDLLIGASRGLLIATGVIWVSLGLVHSHGTGAVERFIKERVVTILEHPNEVSAQVRSFREKIKNRPFYADSEESYVSVPNTAKKENATLPVHNALQIVSRSALDIIWYVALIAFGACLMFVLVCMVIRSIAPAASGAATSPPAPGIPAVTSPVPGASKEASR